MKLVKGLTDAGDVVWARESAKASGVIYHHVSAVSDPQRRQVGEEVRLKKILAPVDGPPLLLCLGMNYADHAQSLGVERPAYPVIVPKGINAAQHPGEPIYLPRVLPTTKVDYEVELVVVLARATRNVKVDEALDYVLGYTCGNDISARDWQFEKGGGQWSRGKSFDTFAPLGPCLVTADEIPDPGALQLRSFVNGELRQSSSTDRMIFTVPEIISFLSADCTLPAWTTIMTGTPAGVGMKQTPPTWLKTGDVVRVEIDGIGTLTNPVQREADV